MAKSKKDDALILIRKAQEIIRKSEKENLQMATDFLSQAIDWLKKDKAN